MGAITAERLLRAWEATLDEQVVRRGAALLAGCRDDDTDAVARWSIADRDAALFDLRGELFGADATALTECPTCGESLEVPLDLGLLRPSPPNVSSDPLTVSGYLVRVRSPSTDDLRAVSANGDEDAALAALLALCVESVLTPAGEEVALAVVPADVGDGIRDHLSVRLEDIDVELELSCGGCASTFQVPFDIATFLLREVEAWASRLLRDVHVIARVYGWDEAGILGLSARRRRSYLDLIEAAS